MNMHKAERMTVNSGNNKHKHIIKSVDFEVKNVYPALVVAFSGERLIYE